MLLIDRVIFRMYSQYLLKAITRRIINGNVSRYSFSTESKNFFSPQNRQRIVERLQLTSSASTGIQSPSEFSQSAVLVPLIDHGGAAGILFTVRSNHLSSHRGEVSFPGGKMDDTDGGSAEKTALREAQEEIGIDPKSVDVWGSLPPMWSRKRDNLITPIVGVIRDGFDIAAFNRRRREHSEVLLVFVRDLDTLADRKHLFFTQFRAGYTLPVFHSGRFRIWGISAIILHSALKVLVPEVYSPVIRYVRPLA